MGKYSARSSELMIVGSVAMVAKFVPTGTSRVNSDLCFGTTTFTVVFFGGFFIEDGKDSAI